MKILLDTHFLLDAAGGNLQGSRGKVLMDESVEIFFSDISLWEISKLYEHKKIQFEIPLNKFLRQICNHPGYNRIHLEPEILGRIPEIGKKMHKDPADQILAATALETRATLLTDDTQLRSYSWLSCA